MSSIVPSDSEDGGAGSDQRPTSESSRLISKPRGKKGQPSLTSPFHDSQMIIDENLHEASGSSSRKSTVNEDKDEEGLKRVQKLENFKNNHPATSYGATATTSTATDLQISKTESEQTTIQGSRSQSQSCSVSHPRPPPMQQQDQQPPPGNQNGRGGVTGGGAVNAPAEHQGDGHPPAPAGGWRVKCSKFWRHVRLVSVFGVVLIFLIGVVSIVVWATVINRQNTEAQIVYANLFEVIPLEEKLHPLTKNGADVKVNLTGRVDPNFQESNFDLSLYRGYCVSHPNQSFTASGRAENYRVAAEKAIVSNHVFMLGPSAELNISFILNNSTLMNDVYFKVYFFKSYEDLLMCNNSEEADTTQNCPCSFFLPNTPSFSYANGRYSDYVDCPDNKPFEGQHYFLTKFLGQGTVRGSPSVYDHLFVNFTFSYRTSGVFDPLKTNFGGQKCNSLDDMNDRIHEYKCGVDYGTVSI